MTLRIMKQDFVEIAVPYSERAAAVGMEIPTWKSTRRWQMTFAALSVNLINGFFNSSFVG